MKNSVKLGAALLVTLFVISACSDSRSNTISQAGDSNRTLNEVKAAEFKAVAPWIASKNTTRINTDDPGEAAVTVSRTLWMASSENNRPGSIILTTLDNWQNAVVSANLIHHPSNGPILFVEQDELPEATEAELKRLKPIGVEENGGVQVILVGNLDQKVEDQVKKLGFKTDKVSAGNPAALAKAIDAYYAKLAGENPFSVIIGSMESREYTMPAINWIAHMPEPLLYVNQNEIPPETKEALETREGKANIYILGPESVISAKVENELEQYGNPIRISGEDPYANAVAFAKYKDPKTGFGWGITTPGHNLSFVTVDSPDLAIAGAPFSHLGKHTPLIWMNKSGIPESVMSYVMSLQPKYESSPTEGPYNHAWLIGSEAIISTKVQGEIDSMLEIESKLGGGHGSMPGMNH
ncbi:cell wall-binding repeat-containing protein [Paenibacillus bouchesdurhonensis]|uniref:cell wall-binding repeat-containing protein n=1 Tax=Paenibacillus bouchesdurhonensis TaxID=1870990 RepID=UPI000DA628FA|nr:ArsR family transcriptional regulator [Paenibacillus bouchesdurhonensis]